MKAAVAVLMMAGLYAAVAAQSAAKTTWDGVYSEAQAKRGEAEYTKTCAGCHGPELAGADAAPSLTGPEFNASWNDLTADELAERVKVTMPADAPNTLSRQQAVDIVAFIFSKDGFPAGQSELPPASDGLKQIKIVSQKP
jgi:S-disulfanyl-L-cysteine oxidoreductase SoxD